MRVALIHALADVDATCSAGVTRTAALSFFRGIEPVIATVMTTGSLIQCSRRMGAKFAESRPGEIAVCATPPAIRRITSH